MDITPSSSRALRQRLWGLFNVYSAVEAPCDAVCGAAGVRRLEAGRFHQCLDALARLNSFRTLFVGSEDDMAIRVAATQLQSRIAQEILWREAVARDTSRAMQQQRPDPLAHDAVVAARAAQWSSNDAYAEDDLLGEACYTATPGVLSCSTTPSAVGDAAEGADRGVSWNALHSVVVVYLYDQHRFHHSFLQSEVDALRNGAGDTKAQADFAAGNGAQGAPCVAGVRAPGASAKASVYAPPPSPRRRSIEIHVDLRLDTEDDEAVTVPLGLLLQTPPRLPRRGVPPTSSCTPTQAPPVPAHRSVCTELRTAARPLAEPQAGEDVAKPAPPPLRKHTQREAAELSAQHTQPSHPPGAVAEAQGGPPHPQRGAGQRPAPAPLSRWSSVSVSPDSSCASPAAAVMDVPASATRRLWSASPSPRRPEGLAKPAATAPPAAREAAATPPPPAPQPVASPSPPAACALRLRLRSPSGQNVMAAKLPAKPHKSQERKASHKDRTTAAAAAPKPKLAIAAGQSRTQRLVYTTRRPQAARDAEADLGTCSRVPAPAALRPVLAEAWPGRRDRCAAVTPTPTPTPPPTTRHDECNSTSSQPSPSPCGTSGAPVSRRASVNSEAQSSGDAAGRRTTALAVERVGGALRSDHSDSSRSRRGNSGGRPSWVRYASPAKAPSPSPAQTARTVIGNERKAEEVEKWMAETEHGEPQAPPTQTSRRRSPPHADAYPSPFSTLREPFHPASHELVRGSATTAVSQPHATAPSPTPTPREVDSRTSPASPHSVHACTASASLMQRAKPRPRPRQPQQAHRPVCPPSPQELVGVPRLLTPSCTSSWVSSRISLTTADEQPTRQRPVSAAALSPSGARPPPVEARAAAAAVVAPAEAPLAEAGEGEGDDGLHTPPQRWSPQRQSGAAAAAAAPAARTPVGLTSPCVPRPGSAAMLPVSPAPGRPLVDGRSPPQRLSARARVRSSSRGSRVLLTPPQVPLTRMTMSPTGSLQVTPRRQPPSPRQ